jgi:hypothetical protein
MNNIQFWIWLIVIVVSLIARARKKQRPPQQNTRRPSQPEFEEASKPLTFEELLREIQGSKAPSPKPSPVRPVEVVDYDDGLGEEAKSLERTDSPFPAPQRTNDIYEKAKQQAFFRPSLEETLKLEDTVVRFGQFKGYQHEERRNLAAEFADEIRNPAGFRKAFIMSEILNRRF